MQDLRKESHYKDFSRVFTVPSADEINNTNFIRYIPKKLGIETILSTFEVEFKRKNALTTEEKQNIYDEWVEKWSSKCELEENNL